MINKVEDRQNEIVTSFQSFSGKEELLARVIQCFPYPIQIYAPDGTSVMVNKAMLDEYNVISPDMIVGKYNIFKDPDILATGQIDAIKRAFQGETVFFQDVKVPLESIAVRYNIQELDVEAIYQDITLFLIYDEGKQVSYVVAILINKSVYRGKNQVEKAKEYIENHWLEPFSLSETAKAACLSRAHFAKLFKMHTGLTPHEYYINYKIEKLKEKLLDGNLSIAQAFAACNMNYNGHSARIFKEKTGLSPSAYKKMREGKED